LVACVPVRAGVCRVLHPKSSGYPNGMFINAATWPGVLLPSSITATTIASETKSPGGNDGPLIPSPHRECSGSWDPAHRMKAKQNRLPKAADEAITMSATNSRCLCAEPITGTIIASATRPPCGGRQAIDPVGTSRKLWVSTRRIESRRRVGSMARSEAKDGCDVDQFFLGHPDVDLVADLEMRWLQGQPFLTAASFRSEDHQFARTHARCRLPT
jgi:hypothetical protein